MITTKTLLATTVYGTPSGNYDGSSQDWAGVAAEAANYYRGRGGLQTVLISVTNVIGEIIIEATLDTVAETATWFETYTYGNSSSAVTGLHSVNIPGNFAWIRARVVGFDGGTINSVTVSY
jgi:hypothetical protein